MSNIENETVVVERDGMVNPANVGAASALLGGLYVTGLTGRTFGKLVGTAAGTYAGYKMGEYLGGRFGNELESLAIVAGVSSTIGMLTAGAGACLDKRASKNEEAI